MPQKAPRIPDEIWDQHKEAIVAFYSTNPLGQTMSYMAEKYGFRASKNQYTARLKAWNVAKYHPGSDWAVIHSKKRKRSEEGKDSDVYIRGRKYTRQEIEKEIARHVPLGQEWRGSESVLPDYITVCTPRAELSVPLDMCRDFLLRDLPWYQCIEEIQTFLSGALRRSNAPSTSVASLELAVRELAPVSASDLPELSVLSGLYSRTKNDVSTYLPPEDLDIRNSSIKRPKTLWDKPPFSVLKSFLQRFIFLSTNELLDQWQFNGVCNRIMEKVGADILVCLCRLRSPLMEVFVEMVFGYAVQSGDILLARKVLQCSNSLHFRIPSQRQRWTKHLSEAVNRRHEAMVELLCKAGVHPEIEYMWSLREYGDSWLRIIRTLLDCGADPETFIKEEATGYPLINAALNGSLGVVRLLLDKGARVDLHLPGYYGTALQAATCRGHLEVVTFLIQHGADINVPRILSPVPFPDVHDVYTVAEKMMISCLSPVQIAARMNHMCLLQILLQHGASAIACPASAHLNFQSYTSDRAKEDVIGHLRYRPQYSNKRQIYTALQYGVINQNLEIVGFLLSIGVDPDSRIALDRYDTPLQMSTRLGNYQMFQLLWSWGADINAPPGTYNGRTALQGAAENGNWEILSTLLRAGAQINAPAGAEYGMTALQAAYAKGHSLIAGVLLTHGADLNTGPSSVGGLSPIQAAALHGDIAMVRELIALGAEVNAPATEGGVTALLAAVKHKSLPLLQLLVQYGADVNASGEHEFGSPLRQAVCHDWFEGVQFLLKHGANVNDTPFDLAMSDKGKEYAPEKLLSPLGWAIENSSKEMTELLLQHGANVLSTAMLRRKTYSIECRSSLMHALCRESSCEIIDMLLAKVPDLEEHVGWEGALRVVLIDHEDINPIARQRIIEKVNSMSPLLRQKVIQKAWNALFGKLDHECIDEKTMVEAIELLIKLGAHPDSRGQSDSTILQRAARYGYEHLYFLLIGHGADLGIPATKFWGTPLQEAIRNSHVNIANDLLGHGVDINALPAEVCGTTALQAAAINGMFELAIRLLERGAYVSAPAAPVQGRTAIDGAAERGRFDMVKLLLNAYGEGTDLEPIRLQAADFAEDEGHSELALWLREYSDG